MSQDKSDDEQKDSLPKDHLRLAKREREREASVCVLESEIDQNAGQQIAVVVEAISLF